MIKSRATLFGLLLTFVAVSQSTAESINVNDALNLLVKKSREQIADGDLYGASLTIDRAYRLFPHQPEPLVVKAEIAIALSEERRKEALRIVERLRDLPSQRRNASVEEIENLLAKFEQELIDSYDSGQDTDTLANAEESAVSSSMAKPVENEASSEQASETEAKLESEKIATKQELYNRPTSELSQNRFERDDFTRSFSKTKSALTSHKGLQRTTFYCGCLILRRGNKLEPDVQNCGVVARKNKQRSSRLEWEHVVPASLFGGQRSCWKRGGRKECSKTDQVFRDMEADPHNLVPVIGELNADRSNFAFGNLSGEERAYGSCDFEVSFTEKIAEPATDIRGDIARMYLYMIYQYGVKVSESSLKLMWEWDASDPVDRRECKRHTVNKEIKGDANPFITKFC
ncbi:MAG: endonuclease [Betaproteobacteria bacterium]